MQGNKRVLVLTLSFGTGHLIAAEAVAADLRRQLPDGEVRLIDALADCRFLFRVFYVWTYWAMIRLMPSLWSRFFAGRVARKDDGTAPKWALRWGFAATLKNIESFAPDLIVACEVAACELAVISKRDNLTTAKIANVITDLEAEPIWVKPEIDAFSVADENVKQQLESWGAEAEKISISGIPIAESFQKLYDRRATLEKFGLDERPVVLLMGGGMGPTRMDMVAAKLIESGNDVQIVALPGHDRRVRGRLEALRGNGSSSSLHILPWTDDVAALMRAADLLVTKPGGVTLAEAAACHLPFVLFDAIPGPEETNALRFTDAGAALMTRGGRQTAAVVLELLNDQAKLNAMRENVKQLAHPDAASKIGRLAVRVLSAKTNNRPIFESRAVDLLANKGPVLILTISNGAGGNRTAEVVAEAIRTNKLEMPVIVVDMADYMTPMTRFTHITLYLWLVKYAPWLWERIDRYQKKQTTTSPEWYYRRGCRKLFRFADEIRPRAVVATEVGCCEIAALIKRDLTLDVPLMAVHTDLDADRAWIQPEVDLYCLAGDECADKFIANGAPAERVTVWGAPLAEGFDAVRDRKIERKEICAGFGLDPARPLILVSGGGEGLGDIDSSVSRLLQIGVLMPQVIVLTGRNKRLKERCERLDAGERLRVLGWIDPEEMPKLMRSADLAVSKLGNFFNEAIACRLPIIALEPPPGGEWEHFRLLAEWGIGKAVRTQDEMIDAVTGLMENPPEIAKIRAKMLTHRRSGAGIKIANWVADRVAGPPSTGLLLPAEIKDAGVAGKKNYAVA